MEGMEVHSEERNTRVLYMERGGTGGYREYVQHRTYMLSELSPSPMVCVKTLTQSK